MIGLHEPAGVRSGDIRGRDVRVTPQATALARQLGEREHAPGPLDVDRPGLLKRQRERHRRRRMDDVLHPRGDLTAPRRRQTEVRSQQVGGDSRHPTLIPPRPQTKQVPQNRRDSLARPHHRRPHAPT